MHWIGVLKLEVIGVSNCDFGQNYHTITVVAEDTRIPDTYNFLTSVFLLKSLSSQRKKNQETPGPTPFKSSPYKNTKCARVDQLPWHFHIIGDGKLNPIVGVYRAPL